jgi:hypothetical protein
MSGKSPFRSVNDYKSADELRKALMSMGGNDGGGDGDGGETVADVQEASITSSKNDAASVAAATTTTTDEPLDWLLPTYDRATTEPQSMREELARLTTLHSYLILDAEKEESFDRLTAVLSRMYDVPIALVSLVDLGRQWFMSNRGLDPVRETARADAFCSRTSRSDPSSVACWYSPTFSSPPPHFLLFFVPPDAINTKDGLLIVPDTRLDSRFVNNCLVTGPPHIRFYAVRYRRPVGPNKAKQAGKHEG